MTLFETILWVQIRGGATGARFRRQVPIGNWIADFASFDPRLVIEVDDESHGYRDETDRTRYIESLGFAILRFANDEITDPDIDVFGTIEHWVEELRAGRRPEQ